MIEHDDWMDGPRVSRDVSSAHLLSSFTTGESHRIPLCITLLICHSLEAKIILDNLLWIDKCGSTRGQLLIGTQTANPMTLVQVCVMAFPELEEVHTLLWPHALKSRLVGAERLVHSSLLLSSGVAEEAGLRAVCLGFIILPSERPNGKIRSIGGTRLLRLMPSRIKSLATIDKRVGVILKIEVQSKRVVWPEMISGWLASSFIETI